LQDRYVAFDPVGIARRHIERLRQEQLLRWDSLLLHSSPQLFEENSLMRSMLIDEDEPIGVFHQDIKLV
jgi:hypothetical protein